MPIARRKSSQSLAAVPAPASGVHRAFSEISFDDDLPALVPPPRSQTMPAVRPSAPEGPRTYRSMELPAVRAPEAACAPEAPTVEGLGRMLETTFLEDEVPLALDLKAPEKPLPAMWAKSGSGVQMVEPPVLNPRPGIVAFAGYGIPPEQLRAAPAYALRVLARQYTLRNDLKIARWRGLPQRDIDLYESALGCADADTFRKGLALTVASCTAAVGAFVAVIAVLF